MSMVRVFAVSAASLVASGVIGYFVTIGLVKPISSDLSVVGQGRPALVLAYENYSLAGGDAINRLRKVRGDFDSRMEFVVADLGTPQGQAFASRFKLVDGQAVFLTPDGEPLVILGIAEDEAELRSRLESKLAAVE